MHQSYLVMRAVSNLRLGLQQSSCGIGGPLSLSVLQKQVGTQLLPFYFSSAADIYLDMKNVRVKSAIRHCCLLIGQSLQTSNRLTGCCFINFFLNRGLQYNLHPVLSRLMKKTLLLFTSSKNLLHHVSSIFGPMTDFRTSQNSSNVNPRSSLVPLLLPFSLCSCVSSPAFEQVKAFLRSCRCSGLSFSAGLTPKAGSLQKAAHQWSVKRKSRSRIKCGGHCQ